MLFVVFPLILVLLLLFLLLLLVLSLLVLLVLQGHKTEAWRLEEIKDFPRCKALCKALKITCTTAALRQLSSFDEFFSYIKSGLNMLHHPTTGDLLQNGAFWLALESPVSGKESFKELVRMCYRAYNAIRPISGTKNNEDSAIMQWLLVTLMALFVGNFSADNVLFQEHGLAFPSTGSDDYILEILRQHRNASRVFGLENASKTRLAECLKNLVGFQLEPRKQPNKRKAASVGSLCGAFEVRQLYL